jgi:pseudaminic acid synthase
LELIRLAAEAGADAVKLQTYTPDTITINFDGPGFQIEGGLWDGRNLYELYKEAHTPWKWHPRLFEYGRELGIIMFSSPFDETAVDFLERLGTPAYKIASFELVDIPLIEYAAKTGKPLVMSTGMAGVEEIETALNAARKSGAEEIALLHCTSGYPTPAKDSNIKTLVDIGTRFGVVSGLSDHTMGISVPVAASALGAAIIEKHFTLRRADGGPDAAFSLEPQEFAEMVTACRTAARALGCVTYERQTSEMENAKLRRSLYAVADIAAGETFTKENIRAIRPGYGLPPKELKNVLGRISTQEIKRGSPIRHQLVAG